MPVYRYDRDDRADPVHRQLLQSFCRFVRQAVSGLPTRRSRLLWRRFLWRRFLWRRFLWRRFLWHRFLWLWRYFLQQLGSSRSGQRLRSGLPPAGDRRVIAR
jgi:hypothetical protein